MNNQDIIASYPLSNAGGVAIYKVDAYAEHVTAGIVYGSTAEPARKRRIHYDRHGEPFFNVGRITVYLNECIRTGV